MGNLLQLQDGAKSYGSKHLFDEASFAIDEQEHVGVIGPNGAGKTTLFKILIGQENLDSGRLIRSRGLRLGYLSQHDEWGANETVESFLSKDAHIPLWTLKQLALRLGLSNEHFDQPITRLSGGYRMRVKLLYLIGQDPNLMLLDEPTNYLDLETLLVLENFLQGYEGAFLLISHDREFLRRTTNQTLEVESGEINKYPGNIDDYFEQKALLREQLAARAQSQAEKKKQILDFAARFGAKASKARQAQSRLKTLSKMENIELKPLPVRARIKIPAPARTGKLVFDAQAVSMGYGEKTVIHSASFQVLSGDHVAVVGLNGAGKSTLLKTLAGEIPAVKNGIRNGYEVSVGYYAQHVAERLDLKKTVFEELEAYAHDSVTRQEVLDIAGSLLFSGNDVHKKIQLLSGGERARVALGQILLQKATCLILDEPTNHLDFDTVEALTQSLVDYPGTVVLVSHDRSFTKRVGTKILEIDQGKLSLYFGTYDDYVWRIQRLMLQEGDSAEDMNQGTATPAREESPSSPSPSGYRETKKSLDRELKQVEKAIQGVEARILEVDASLRSVQKKLAQENTPALLDQLNALSLEQHELEERWMTLSEKRDSTQLALQTLTGGSPNG